MKPTPQCSGCHRTQMRGAGGRWITIKLNAQGECPACEQARAEIEAQS